MAKSSRDREYDYNPSYDEVVDRAERKGSMFDTLFKDVKVYAPKQGANLLRILPPSWKGARHFGLRVKIHYDVGPEDRRYLCLRDENSPHKRCPVCEALYDLGPNATQEEKRALRAGDGIVYYVIDRDAEKDGVQVWLTSPTNDSEIAAQMVNRRNKSVLPIAHPDDGYDVEFSRTGTGKMKTRYRGFQIMRESSPLSDNDKRADEWLDAVFDHPLPTVLNFYSPERIEEVFYGRQKDRDDAPRGRARDRDPDDADERPPLRRTRDADDEEVGQTPPRRARSRDDDEPEKEPPRSGRRSGRDPDDADESEARVSGRSSGERPGRDPDDADEPPRRSRLAREIDDEIPTEGSRRARSNGQGDDPVEERPRARARLDEGEEKPSRRGNGAAVEEKEPPRRAARGRTDDDDDEPERPRRGRDVDEDANEQRRERMRGRLNRE